MEIINTMDPQNKPPVTAMIYGEAGVGKTTFASTAPKPLLADCEMGAKYFGLRDIDIDVAQIKKWPDIYEYYKIMAKTDEYETAVIDPIGELMKMLKEDMVEKGNSKLVQSDGSPTMAGWGRLKKRMRDMVRKLKSSGKHVLIIAHLDEQKDEDRVIKRPKIQTKLSTDLVGDVDVVGYMTMRRDKDGNPKRVIIVDPEDDTYTAKDRTGQLGRIIEPNFTKIVKACQGTEKYSWSNKDAKTIKNNKKKAEEMDLKSKTVKELKEILREKDMKVSGTKDELISRLAEEKIENDDDKKEESKDEEQQKKVDKKKEEIKKKMKVK